MKKIVAFLYQYLVNIDNKLTKILPHRRVICFEEMNRVREYVSKKFIEQRIIKQSEELAERSNVECNEEIAEDLEKLDEDISRIMEDAENKIPDYPKFWWSDTLHNAYQVVEY